MDAFVCPFSKEVINRRKGKTPQLLALTKKMPASCYACGFCLAWGEQARDHLL